MVFLFGVVFKVLRGKGTEGQRCLGAEGQRY